MFMRMHARTHTYTHPCTHTHTHTHWVSFLSISFSCLFCPTMVPEIGAARDAHGAAMQEAAWLLALLLALACACSISRSSRSMASNKSSALGVWNHQKHSHWKTDWFLIFYIKSTVKVIQGWKTSHHITSNGLICCSCHITVYVTKQSVHITT